MSTSSASSSSLPSDRLQRQFVEELLSFSSNASCNLEWKWSSFRPNSLNEQSHCSMCLSRSDSLQGIYCPLPGQVPVEPTVSSIGLTPPQRAMKASPVNRSSTEQPTEFKLMKRIRSFGKWLWKAMKRPFCCCCSSSVDVVEPFVLPPDLDPEPEPSSSVPDHSGVKPNDESFESLFDVVKMIGSGGYGSVYEGTRKFDGKKVAIKRMRKIDNNCYLNIPGHPEPLITEVALLLMMRQEPRSPYTIQLYDWFEHPRKFTLVMEYPEPCQNLLEFLIDNELDERTARTIMRQAVLAVQHCIEHGVFHNDIHTQNFLLKKDTLELKLIDFGCGQLLSSDGYESNTYAGVMEYSPPEVHTKPRFHAVPTNVWALGVLLYGMLNRSFPFCNAAEAKVAFENPDLSEECRDLISQCLNLDPSKRPTIEQILQHEWIRKDGL